MDIISYGVASKAAKGEKKTREDVLGIGVEGSNPHVKGRIDLLEESLDSVNTQADKLILNDSINIMKAHAKLNAIAKTTKYKMHNMIFDDLLDLSGIDTTKSSGYVHDAVNGLLKSAGAIPYKIETKTEVADAIPSKVILSVEEYTVNLTQGVYSISRDGGATWQLISPDSLFYFDANIGKAEKNLRIKAELPSGTQLLNYALTWA